MNEVIRIDLPYFRRISSEIQTACRSQLPVLIWGETGTGKTALARYIHDHSSRRSGPFINVHPQAIPENLLESELFGFVKGAFTGAVKEKDGLLRRAHGGSLFLDQLESMPIPCQAKLLEAIETGSFRRLGETQLTRSDFRLLAASIRNPESLVVEGVLRKDFYFRLKGILFFLPPLRERIGDLEVLMGVFLQNLSAELGRKLRFTPEAREIMLSYSWPGNIRELYTAIRAMAHAAKGEWIEAENVQGVLGNASTEFLPLCEVVCKAEREHIGKALLVADGRLKRAAHLLGISLNTLKRKMREYGLQNGRAASGGGVKD